MAYISQLNTQGIKAAILLSPILESKANKRLDQNVTCPVLLIHGQANKISHYSLTQAFAKLLKTVDEWYPSNGSYSNITIRYRRKFYLKLKEFISFIQTIHPRSHYITTPLFMRKFNDNNTVEDKDKHSSGNQTNANSDKNKKDEKEANVYSSGVLSSYIDSSFDNEDDSQYDNENNININTSNRVDNYFEYSSYDIDIENEDQSNTSYSKNNSNNINFNVHRRESEMILKTIRSFNVK